MIFNAIQYKPSMGGEASFGSAGNLSFRDRDCIKYEYLEHEYFHMFQSAVAGNFTYHTSIENVCATEFEQHLHEDLVAMIAAGSDWSNMARTWACTFESGYDEYGKIEERYKIWLASLTNNGSAFPNNIPVEGYHDFLRLYWEKTRIYGARRGLECDVNNSFPTALNIALADAIKNCSSIF
ncbi:hypothetical protein BANORC5_08850 [Bacteroides nordii]|nr:hypothetical protein BANORC5_08850 [Bacteroides nordii]